MAPWRGISTAQIGRLALFLARQWERFGDRMRDEATLMREVGLAVIHREEFGPWRCLRVVVGER